MTGQWTRRCASTQAAAESAAEGWMVQWLLIAVGALVAGLILLLLAFVFGMRAKSPVVLRAVRRLNRRFMNPIQMKTAGTPGAYAGVIRHVGRRSGRVYETPVGPFATEGHTYEVDQPEIVPLSDVVDALPSKERRNLRLFRVEQALRARRRG